MENVKSNGNETKVVTGKVRLSYASVFEPKSFKGGAPKYSTVILIPKSDKETVNKIRKAIEVAKEEGKSKKWGGKIPSLYWNPLRDGDEAKPDDENYAGHYFMKVSSKEKPKVVKATSRNIDGTLNLEDITDTTEVYSGCYARLSLSFYPYDVDGGRGIGVGLNSLLKIQDGERLSGYSGNVQEDFGSLNIEIPGEDPLPEFE